MRYAVLSDIHGNLEALRAVLERVAALDADRTLCCGDIVGYNADPKACVAIVRSEGIMSVLGNHDAVACGLAEPYNFNPAAREVVLWTRSKLLPENAKFLRELPRHFLVNGIALCHGSINDTNRYIIDDSDVRDNFALLETLSRSPDVCFFGHTHIRAAYSLFGRTMARELTEEMRLSRDRKYLINPGAVGQPRDGDPQAAFLIYDSRERTIIFLRVEYDIPACQVKIIQAGLPTQLAERLSIGS